MKNFFKLSSLVLATSLTTSCVAQQEEKEVTEIKYDQLQPSTTAGAILQLDEDSNVRSVKHVTDGGPVTDKSFNETIFKGLTDYNGSSALNSAIKPNSDSSVSAKIALYQATFKKTQVIVAGGFQHNDALKKFGDDIPKDKGIIYVDGEVKNPKINNIIFNIQEGAFYAGYAAADYLNKNVDTFKEDGLKVGTFGGRNFPTVTAFMAGFQQGVEYFNEMKGAKQTEVEFVKLGSKVENYFSGSFQAGKGRAISDKLLAKGADIILPVAGPQTGDALIAIKEKKSKSLVIGVDTDQVKLYTEHVNSFLTSILKRMDIAVTNSLKYIFKKSSDTDYGLGRTTVGTMENGLVGLASGGENKLSESAYEDMKNNAKLVAAAKKAKNIFKL